MIENQEELRSALQMNQEQKQLIKQLEKEQTSGQDGSPRNDNEQLLTQVYLSLDKMVSNILDQFLKR